MTKWMHVWLAGAVAVSLGSAFSAEEEKTEKDEAVSQADLPAKVAEAVKEYGEGGEFEKAVKADEDGVAVYEVTVKKGERKIEVQTTLDGELNMREETVEASVLPKAVVDRVNKAHPGSKIVGVEKTLRAVYEVQVVDKDGKKSEALVTPGGQLATEPEELDAAPGKKGESEADEKDEKDEKASKNKQESKSEKGVKAEKGEKSEKGEASEKAEKKD